MANAIKRCAWCFENGIESRLECKYSVNGKKTYKCLNCGIMVDVDAKKRTLVKVYRCDNAKM